jgi:hypothetical protein
MDTPSGCGHPEPERGVRPGEGDIAEHPAMRRIVERIHRATDAERARLAAYPETADDAENQEGKDRDGATTAGD